MEIVYQNRILRSKMLAMSRLTQRAIEHSIRAIQHSSPGFCQNICDSMQEVQKLRRCISDLSRAVLAREVLADRTLNQSDSHFACCALQICNVLCNSHASAVAIARNIMRRVEFRQTHESSALEEMGRYVNSLVRLNTVALFKRDVKLAKEVLESYGRGQWSELATCLAQNDPTQQSSAESRFEVEIATSLSQIAEQAHEIADAITFWLEDRSWDDGKSDRAVHVSRESNSIRVDDRAEVTTHSSPMQFTFRRTYPERESSEKNSRVVQGHSVLGRNAITLVDLHWGNPAEIFEEECQTRLTSLQNRICELLVTNQQLRMALMTAGAYGPED